MDIRAVVIRNHLSAQMISRGQTAEVNDVISKTGKRTELASGEAINPIVDLLMNKGSSAFAPSRV